MSWVEVPDLRKGKLAISSLFLGKDQSSDGQGGEAKPTQAGKQTPAPKLIQGKATFRKGEIAFYRFAVYNLKEDASAMVKVEIVQNETPVYTGDWQPLSSRIVGKDKKAIEAGGQLRLGLEPGVYELRVTIKEAKSKKAIERTMPFEVES